MSVTTVSRASVGARDGPETPPFGANIGDSPASFNLEGVEGDTDDY
ncbi:hypothetical protein [Halovenus marina]